MMGVSAGDPRRLTRGARSAPASALRISDSRLPLIILLCVTVLQRLAVPGSGGELGVGFVLCFAAFLYGIFKGLLVLSPQRIVLYCVAASALLLTLFARSKEFSLLSLPMLLVLYAPYMAVAPMAREDYVKLLGTFQTVVLFCAACAIVQFLIQFPLGANAMFPLDLVLPESFFIQGFNLRIPVTSEGAILKSTGFWFLEPSHLSQIIAFAIVIEYMYFCRPAAFALFGAAYLTSFSGTGFILLVGVAIALAVQQRQMLPMVIIGIASACVLVLFRDVFPFSALVDRLAEFGNKQGSGSMRFLGPFWFVGDVIATDLRALWFGFGPGAILDLGIMLDYRVQDSSWLKLVAEYGLFGAIPFLAFYLYCLFRRSPNLIISVACLIQFTFLGGYLNAFYVQFLHMALAGWPKLTPGAGDGGSREGNSKDDDRRRSYRAGSAIGAGRGLAVRPLPADAAHRPARPSFRPGPVRR